jgi:hypothetical protein
MHIIKTIIGLAYIFGGLGLFIYLFCKFLRRGISDTGAQRESPLVQNYRVNMKIRTDGTYFVRFIALMIGLFAFAATVAYVANEWGPFDFLFTGE